MFKTEPDLRTKFYSALVVCAIFIFGINNLNGQDIHYSQFYNSPLNINPALTGVFNGDVRAIGSLRDQWRAVSVPYTTFTGNFDMKLYPKNRNKSFFGVGAIFNYDQSGDGSYNISDLNILGSYNYAITRNNIISAGLLLGVATEGYDRGGLTWDRQWNGLEFDPNLSPGENFKGGDRFSYLETGLGVNYRFQKSNRTYFNLGIGAWHLNTPTAQLVGDDTSEIPVRLAFNFEGLFKLAQKFDLQLHANHNRQDPYVETVFGGLGRIHFNEKAGYAIDLGASYRTTGFIMPTLALHVNQWYVGASYDVTLRNGPLREDHGIWQGGWEVHVRYILTKVQPLEDGKKACLIF